MSSYYDLKYWIQTVHRPVILVATTTKVEETCSKNNLSFTELLKPFERLDNINIFPVRLDSGPTGTRVRSISVRFVNISEINSLDINRSEEYLKAYCQRLGSIPILYNANFQISIFDVFYS